MMKNTVGEKFIRELLEDSEIFENSDKGIQLLQEYFDGFPLVTLRPLLRHNDRFVRRMAAFIVSELGTEARCLIHDISPLVTDEDIHIQWDAIESVLVCSTAEHVNQFVHILFGLNSDDGPIRRLVMRLVSNAENEQLEAGVEQCETLGSSGPLHKLGLKALLEADSLRAEEIVTMIDSKQTLIRSYGAIAAKTLYYESPELIAYAASSTDEDVSKFSQKVLDMNVN